MDPPQPRALRNARVRELADRGPPGFALRRVLRHPAAGARTVCEIEIGWHVHKHFWNQGVATEAATLVCDAATSRLGLSRLIALVHADHIASRRVAEKVGMHPERAMVLEGDYPAIVYAADFARRRATSHRSG